ncbi:hypothetical protein EDC96DRAFT_544148 [Choanephora cucurbitarum]|nr:hypothetical protein EDC96DRAFT_544148 [Choanephora cucurbitarum]
MSILFNFTPIYFNRKFHFGFLGTVLRELRTLPKSGDGCLRFGVIAESSKFFRTCAVNMNVFYPLLLIQVKPTLTKGEAVYIVANISGEDVPRKKVLCKCQPLAAQGDTLNLISFTSILTELRPAEPTATELVLAEDRPD